ncbi:MAG: hypothetical protein Q8O64_05720 [Sideroxyarcus sp.]|nr:hypothetical protein [Sideroxyarcus sp.]
MEQLLKNQLTIIAAFLMSGLCDTRDQSGSCVTLSMILEKWDRGCIELVDEMVEHAPFIEECFQVGLKVTGDVTGVFDYEVTESFGRWFGEYVLRCGDTPSEKLVREELARQVVSFFTNGMAGNERSAAAREIENTINTLGTQETTLTPGA